MIEIIEGKPRRLPGASSLFVKFNYNKVLVDEVKLIDCATYLPEDRLWEIPVTAFSTFADKACIYDSIQVTLLPEQVANHAIEPICEYKLKPFDYQLEGIQYGLNHNKWLLLDPPGLGKTAQIINIAKELQAQRNLQHCLIICGINSLKTNWAAEINKHSDLSVRILGQRYNRKGKLVIDGLAQRKKQLEEKIDEFFVVTNIETLRDDEIIKLLLNSKQNKFDMMVVDEIHVAKNPNSAQGKNLLKLRKCTYQIGATGTLLLNNPLDTYLPLKWLSLESCNYSQFKGFYCRYGGLFGNELIGFKNLDVLKQQIEMNSLRRPKEILNLPPKTIINECVDMDIKQQQFYDNIINGIVTQVDKVTIKSDANLLALVARLRQATACPSILTTENIPSAKLERAIDLSDQIIANGDKVVIFSTFKESVYRLKDELSKQYKLVVGTGDYDDYEIERAKQQFQEDPETKIFLGTWQKCGTGITLTAASYMIFIDCPWTAAVFEQAQDRIYRIGTERPVFIYHLIANSTIDDRVAEILNDKKYLSSYVIDNEVPPEALPVLRKYIEGFF